MSGNSRNVAGLGVVECNGREEGSEAPETENRMLTSKRQIVTPSGSSVWSLSPSHRSYGTTETVIPGRGLVSCDGELDSSSVRHAHAGVSLWQRMLAGTGVLALFALGVTTANFKQARRWHLEATEISRTTEQTSSFRTADSPSPLTVTATNEYGTYDRAALALYGLEMVIEPYRETTITTAATSVASSPATHFLWRVVEVSDSAGVPEDSFGVVFEEEGGPEVTVELSNPGAVYLLTVREEREDGTVVAEGMATISCKYVRREIRDLSDGDRKEFFDAMEVYYTKSNEEGRAEYGERFFNYERLTAYHNAALDQFCYHAGLQFLTAHASFGLMMERSLQTINPRVSLAFWDYMIDASALGTEWSRSPIFDDDMFGRAVGSAEDSYQITKGRFGNVVSIYDPDDALVDSRICPHHNAYGYLSATYNYQDLPRLTRTGSFCNLKASSKFATSDDFMGCFSEYNTLGAWESCMEGKVHGDIHGLLGGAFNCNVDMQQFHEEHPEFSQELLTFFLMSLTTKYWPNNTFLPDSNDCDTECVRGQTEPCGCTCSVDATSMSEDEVYSLTSDFLEFASNRFTGGLFVSYDESSGRPWGFKQGGVRLDNDATMFLLRHVIKIGCEPNAVGAMTGGASPMDPIFWVLHPMFEKALHVLWMSPQYRDSYSFEWKDGTCSGSRVDDVLPFTEQDLGFGEGTEFLTNAELMSFFHPGSSRLPYVFENFAEWGAADDWDFCPECVAASSTAAI